jgi:hypothetical protein
MRDVVTLIAFVREVQSEARPDGTDNTIGS